MFLLLLPFFFFKSFLISIFHCWFANILLFSILVTKIYLYWFPCCMLCSFMLSLFCPQRKKLWRLQKEICQDIRKEAHTMGTMGGWNRNSIETLTQLLRSRLCNVQYERDRCIVVQFHCLFLKNVLNTWIDLVFYVESKVFYFILYTLSAVLNIVTLQYYISWAFWILNRSVKFDRWCNWSCFCLFLHLVFSFLSGEWL